MTTTSGCTTSNVLVLGEKTWDKAPPGYHGADSFDMKETFKQNEGDMVVIPPGHVHAVLTDEVDKDLGVACSLSFMMMQEND